jgi:DNA-binding MarR family transcriptional regulator
LLPSEFAERAGVTGASVTSLLDGLERDRLVTRQPHATDRRMITVQIRDKGRELMNKDPASALRLDQRLDGESELRREANFS